MKMNKILAAGVAASLAVTSLAAVASAAERTFEMKYTTGNITYSAKADKEINVSLDNMFGYAGTLPGGAAAVGHYAPTNVAPGALDVTNDTVIDYRDFDAFIPVMIEGNPELLKKLGTVKVVINGRKMDNGNLVAITQTATLEKTDVYHDHDGLAATAPQLIGNYILPIFYEIAPQGAFLANDFVAVDSIQVVNPSAGDITLTGFGKDAYNTITGETGKYTLIDNAAGDNVMATTNKAAASAKATIAVKAATKAWQIDPATTAVTYGTVRKITLSNAAAAPAASVALFDKIIELIGTKGINFTWWNASGEKKDNEAWLPVTDGWTYDRDQEKFVYNAAIDNGTIERMEVHALSITGDWGSGSNVSGSDWGNQTYNVKDYNEGTMPQGFSGLASQVADFFNKQLNGTITFHFTAGKAAAGDNWLAGGVPSTEVGIKNAITGMTKNDAALFVNYNSTTGSLQAATEVKAEELAVVFDITEILEALNGQTIGTVQDIYYGLVKGVEYDGYATKGFKVDKVVLAYEEEAEEEDVIDEEETEEVEEEETEEEEVEEVEEEEETEEVEEVEEEEEEEETDDVGGDMFEEEEETEEEDSNPGTGVALAVVPAIMAAAAVVVSKKRK